LRALLCAAVILPSLAHADDAPGFVTLDRFDATTRGGIELSYGRLDTDVAKETVWRIDPHGQYVDRDSGFGGYASLPISDLTAGDFPGTGVGALDVGAIYARAVPDRALVLVAHAGVGVPTASHVSAGHDANQVGAYTRDADTILSGETGVAVRVGASAIWRVGPRIFMRADLGNDASTAPFTFDRVRFGFGVGLDLGQLALLIESEDLWQASQIGFGPLGDAFFENLAFGVRTTT
jgi:hypothetical protein